MGSLKKTLLILSGGIEAIEGIKIAKKMGLRTIVCDGNENAPGKSYGDEFLVANIYDPYEIKNVISEYSKKESIDGVITIASDAVRSVSTVAKQHNLPGISLKTSILATNKLKMKKAFQQYSLPIPNFVKINCRNELHRQIQHFDKAVLKPVDSRGSRGVIIINKNSDINKAFDYSIKFSPTRKLILEEWLSGSQLSTESLVISGKTHLCGIADRNYSNQKDTFPYIVEDGGETPSRYYPKIKNKLEKILDTTAKSLGIENGVLKGDLVLKNNNIYLIEAATRLSGGFFSTITIPLVYRISLIEKAILLALGSKIVPPPKFLKHYCYQANRFLFPKPGLIKKVIKPNQEKLPKYVKYIEVNAKVGERVDSIKHHPMRKGSVLVIGKTRSEAIKRAEKIRALIKIETVQN